MNKKVADPESEINRLTEVLRQSEELFRKVFHASSNMMAIHTIKEGRFVDVNEAAASFGGYKREELIGHTMQELKLWDDPYLHQIVAQRLKDEGKAHNIELKARTKEGKIRIVLAFVDPVTINDESCLLAVSVDITEREEKADALRRSEEKYRMLVENSLLGLAITQDGRFVFCNNTFAAMWGYSMQELLSLSPMEKDEMIHPDYRDVMKQLYGDRLSGKPMNPRFEFRGVKKDGAPIWLEVHTSLIEYNEKPAVQSVCMDITAFKDAEEALKNSKEYYNQIINHISDPIFVKDRSHNFVLVNDALCAFAGKSREELLDKPDMPENLMFPYWEQEEEVFKTGKELITEDIFPEEQGAVRTLMTKKSLLTDKNGNKQIVGVLRDITEYKRLEAQFLQSQKMEAIGVLAGGVAHDFNNLLNVINGYAELMLQDLEPDHPMSKDLTQIRDAGQRASTLTSQLLAFGRKQIMKPEVFNLNQVIANMSSMLRRLIGEDIHIETNIPSAPIMINADLGKIQQVILNLVVNARDAMPHGGKLTVETADVEFEESYIKKHPMSEPGSYVMLAISDNGAGMDEKTQARIFEPFFTTKGKGKGTGLGLSTVYGIVKQSNGFIWVYSEPGKGTTVKTYFPRVTDPAVESRNDKKTDAEPKGSETVLLVEDEEAVRSFISRVLKESGYNVLAAADGIEALHLVQDYMQEIHMVVTDVVMPAMGGKALISHLEEVRPNIKSLYISGYTDNAIVNHGVLESGIAFLQKPFSVENLIGKVREVLDA